MSNEFKKILLEEAMLTGKKISSVLESAVKNSGEVLEKCYQNINETLKSQYEQVRNVELNKDNVKEAGHIFKTPGKK